MLMHRHRGMKGHGRMGIMSTSVAEPVMCRAPIGCLLILNLDAIQICSNCDVVSFGRTEIDIKQQAPVIFKLHGFEPGRLHRFHDPACGAILLAGCFRVAVQITPEGDHVLFRLGNGVRYGVPPWCMNVMCGRIRHVPAAYLVVRTTQLRIVATVTWRWK